jgi:hypothetical protein
MAAAPLQRMEDEEPLQGKFDPVQRMEDDEALQRQAHGAASTSEEAPVQREAKPNNTGLPDQLKSGIESLSGMSMDHVQVHYNSDKPAQLQAHAYAQGNQIHVAPGQDQHLPHEAWHVVQQAQGRVRPTLQMKGLVPVNDDAGHNAEPVQRVLSVGGNNRSPEWVASLDWDELVPDEVMQASVRNIIAGWLEISTLTEFASSVAMITEASARLWCCRSGVLLIPKFSGSTVRFALEKFREVGGLIKANFLSNHGNWHIGVR